MSDYVQYRSSVWLDLQIQNLWVRRLTVHSSAFQSLANLDSNYNVPAVGPYIGLLHLLCASLISSSKHYMGFTSLLTVCLYLSLLLHSEGLDWIMWTLFLEMTSREKMIFTSTAFQTLIPTQNIKNMIASHLCILQM